MLGYWLLTFIPNIIYEGNAAPQYAAGTWDGPDLWNNPPMWQHPLEEQNSLQV